MKRALAIILAILFMLPVCALALDFSKPELDHGAAVKRIEDAKTHWIEKGEPSDADTSRIRVVIDTLDLYNSGNLSFTQRLVTITEDVVQVEDIAEPKPAVIIKPKPVVIIEPEPEPVVIIEPEPEPEIIIEPDPTVIIEPEPEPTVIIELEPEEKGWWTPTTIITILIFLIIFLVILSKRTRKHKQ